MQIMMSLNKNSRFLLFGQALSFMGDYCALPALLVLSIYYDNVWMTTGVIVCRSIPTIFQPFIGVFIDRLNKVKVMVWTDIFRGVAFSIIFFIPEGTFPSLFIISLFISYGAGVLFNPARLAIMSSLGDEVKMINVLFAKATTLFIIFGASVGALLTLWGDVKYAVLINSLTYFYSAYLINKISIKNTIEHGNTVPITKINIFSDFKEGVVAVTKNSKVLNAVFTMLIMAFLWGVAYSYFPHISKLLNISNNDLGTFILTICIGVGGFIGASIINYLGYNEKKGTLIFSLLSFLSISAFIYFQNFYYCLAAALVFFINMEYGEILAKVNVQESSSFHVQGRVFALSEALIGVFISLGSIMINIFSLPEIILIIFLCMLALGIHSLSTIKIANSLKTN